MRKRRLIFIPLFFAGILLFSCNRQQSNDSTQTRPPQTEELSGVIDSTTTLDATGSLLEKADTADFAALESLASEMEKDGTIDREIAILEKRAAETDAPPSVFIALSVLYGRKNLKTKEYTALVSAENAAKRPGVVFNVALLYGRKKLLAGSPDADSFMVGTLIIETTPQGASLNLDGKESGKTPITLEKVTASSHTLTLSLENYSPISLKPEIRVGGTSRISHVFVPIKQAGPNSQRRL